MPAVVRDLQVIDLGRPGARSRPIDVSGVDTIAVRGIDAARWASGEVELLVSYDGAEFVPFGTPVVLDASTILFDDNVDVQRASAVCWEVEVAQAGITAALSVFGKEIN